MKKLALLLSLLFAAPLHAATFEWNFDQPDSMSVVVPCNAICQDNPIVRGGISASL